MLDNHFLFERVVKRLLFLHVSIAGETGSKAEWRNRTQNGLLVMLYTSGR